MIKFEHVSFSYETENVLRDFSMQVAPASRVCLFGASGCGKTTVLRLAMGLARPKKGKVTCNAKRIAPVFQEDRLIESYTVLENVNFGCSKDGMQIVEAVGLGEFAHKLPCELSGGQKRRVALARALNHDAELLVLDEAFNGLDEQTVKLCADAVEHFAGDRTILMVSHNKAWAQLLGAQLLYMDDKKME